MKWTSFRLGLGRMSENHPVAKIYAEGLINPLCGRGTNYISVEKLYSSVLEDKIKHFMVPAFEKINLDKRQHKKAYKLTKQYLDTIQAKHDMSEKYLFRMNIALQILFPGIWNNQELLISSDKITLEDPKIKILWKHFNTFKIENIIKTFNPVYDLFAAYILLNIIQTNMSNASFIVENDYQNQFDKLIVEYFTN